MTLGNHFSSFFRYVKSPTLIEDKQELTIFQTLKFILVSYILLMLANVFIALPVFVLLDSFDLTPQYSQVLPHILIVAFIVPIMEELTFRLPIVFRRETVLISIVLFLFIISRSILKNYLYASLIAGAALAILALIFYYKPFGIKGKFDRFERKHFRFIFYFYALLFGLLHITNFTFSSPWQVLVSPLIVIPQLIYGFVFGYMRATYKWGLVIAIGTHILINLIAGLLKSAQTV